MPTAHADVLDALQARAATRPWPSDDRRPQHYRSRPQPGVKPADLRYYERCRLLAEPDRSLGGHRLDPSRSGAFMRGSGSSTPTGTTTDPSTA